MPDRSMTLLTSFKPFAGQSALHQQNALASWRALDVELEILAFGDPPGLDALAPVYGIEQVRDIPSFQGRLPRIDTVLAYGQEHGRHDLQIYVNGDIILFDDLVEALLSIRFPRFVMMGQRFDVEIDQPLDFRTPTARASIKRELRASGRLHDVGGIDYFAWRRGSMPALPAMFLGAAGWDNFTIFCCRAAGIPVIDATQAVSIFHQDHEPRWRSPYEKPAARFNLDKSSAKERFYTLDASHWLDGKQVKPALSSPRHAWRMILSFPVVRRWPPSVHWPFRGVAAIVRRITGLWITLRREPTP